MTLAVMVLGAESSGNRLMARLLIAAGCYGDGHISQRLDDGIPAAVNQPVVWIRSIPHGDQVPDLSDCFHQLRQQGYEVRAIVMLRCWYPMICSQAKRITGDKALAEQRTRQAYAYLFPALFHEQIDYVTVTLSELITRPDAVIRWLCEWLGLAFPVTFEPVMDVNERHWR